MKTTFVYKRAEQCDIKGDFYSVSDPQAPLIVYIHGGGLIWGSRNDMNKEQINLYNKAGLNVFSLDYRLAPETKLAEITEDIQDALVWLKGEGREMADYDAENIAVVGSSAGGYLALSSGTFRIKPKAIVSFYGYGDITGDWYRKPSAYFTNMPIVQEQLAQQLIQEGTISEAPIEKRYAIYLYCRQQGKWIDFVTGLPSTSGMEQLHAYCPLMNIDANYPATLLLHGDMDEDVPFEQSSS